MDLTGAGTAGAGTSGSRERNTLDSGRAIGKSSILSHSASDVEELASLGLCSTGLVFGFTLVLGFGLGLGARGT